MSKVPVILVFAVLFSSCSIIKKKTSITYDNELSSLSLPDRIKERNITATDFNIQKAEIEIINNNEKQKVLGSLKYRNPGIYLMSIRSKSGIEAARIYITNDTILLNDRIYKKLYYGSPEYIEGKYGLSAAALPLLIGDFIYAFKSEDQGIICDNGKGDFEGYLKNRKIWYKIDCNKEKAIISRLTDEYGDVGINIEFSDFDQYEKYIFPKKIVVEDAGKETVITIKIKNFEFNPEKKIDFIPGNRYEKVLLK